MINNIDQRTIENTLKQLWLIDSEIAVFLVGLENWALSIAQLSTLCKIGRITVHEIVGRLIKKGLFLETRSWRKRLVYPNQIDALERLIDGEKLRIQKLEKAAKKASSLLRSIQNQAENFPKTRFYKGKEWIKRMLSEIKKDKKNISIMSDGQHFYELVDNEFLEESLELRNKKELWVRLIFPTGFEYFTYTQGTYQQQLKIKSLPNEQLLKWGITLRWEKVAFHCYEGKFITTTILENTQIANIMAYMFEHIWDGAKDY